MINDNKKIFIIFLLFLIIIISKQNMKLLITIILKLFML